MKNLYYILFLTAIFRTDAVKNYSFTPTYSSVDHVNKTVSDQVKLFEQLKTRLNDAQNKVAYIKFKDYNLTQFSDQDIHKLLRKLYSPNTESKAGKMMRNEIMKNSGHRRFEFANKYLMILTILIFKYC